MASTKPAVKKQQSHTAADSAVVQMLRQLRMRELDREFRRQTKELRRLTKSFRDKLHDIA